MGTNFSDLEDGDAPAQARPQSAPAAGALFVDCYRLHRVIGRGGAGVVWEAQDERPSDVSGRLVAIKILPLGSALREVRASREIAIGRGLTGPGFVPVFDAGIAPPYAFVVMERLVGEDLASRLDREGRLGIAGTLRIARQLATALGIAHASGLVHRDLKPTNVFLAAGEGEREVVKLLDFGVAKRLGIDARVTASNTLLGAPQYSAPEQLSSAPRVDTRADVWSMAAMMYRCLLGKRPFDGQGAELLAKVIGEPHPLPSIIDPSLPRGLDGVFARGLAKRPEHRYPTASLFVHDLEKVLFGWR